MIKGVPTQLNVLVHLFYVTLQCLINPFLHPKISAIYRLIHINVIYLSLLHMLTTHHQLA